MMVVISFSVFKEKLLSGDKRQTIRRHNAERIDQMKRLGIQIYWKQRSPTNSEKLFDAKFVESYKIKFVDQGEDYPEVFFNLHKSHENFFWCASKKFRNKIAVDDGFKNYAEMCGWFCSHYGEEMFKIQFDVIQFKKVEE